MDKTENFFDEVNGQDWELLESVDEGLTFDWWTGSF